MRSILFGRFFVGGSGADTAFRLDVAHSQQGALGQCRAYQFIDQNSEQDNVACEVTVRQGRSGDRHALFHTGLGQQSDTQIV